MEHCLWHNSSLIRNVWVSTTVWVIVLRQRLTRLLADSWTHLGPLPIITTKSTWPTTLQRLSRWLERCRFLCCTFVSILRDILTGSAFYLLWPHEVAGTSGAIFDAIGPRILIPGSGIIVVFSLFMLSITKPQQIYQQILSQSLLFSFGATLRWILLYTVLVSPHLTFQPSYFPSMGLLAHWFKHKIPYAVGCLVAGASVGGIVYPIMISKLIPKIGFGKYCFNHQVLSKLTIYNRLDNQNLCLLNSLLLRRRNSNNQAA